MVCRNKSSSRLVSGFSPTVTDPLRRTEENYQEDCFPFLLDDESSRPEGSTLLSKKKSSMKSTFGFDLNAKLESTSISNNVTYASRYSSVTQRPEIPSKRLDHHKISGRNLTNPLGSPEQIFANPYPKGINTELKLIFILFCFSRLDLRLIFQIIHNNACICSMKLAVTDSLENIDQEYVLVSGPPMDVSSSSVNASKPSHSLFRTGSFPQESSNTTTRLSGPMPIVGASTNSMCQIGSSGSQDSAPGTSHGSMDTGDEQPSTNIMARVKSLQDYASALRELVDEKVSAA